MLFIHYTKYFSSYPCIKPFIQILSRTYYMPDAVRFWNTKIQKKPQNSSYSIKGKLITLDQLCAWISLVLLLIKVIFDITLAFIKGHIITIWIKLKHFCKLSKVLFYNAQHPVTRRAQNLRNLEENSPHSLFPRFSEENQNSSFHLKLEPSQIHVFIHSASYKTYIRGYMR